MGGLSRPDKGRCVLATVAVLVGLAGGAATQERPTRAGASGKSPTTTSVAVATFNINFGNANLKEVVRAIRESKADFVFIQESNAESERFLRTALAKEYPNMTFRHAPAAGGLGFLAKAPITSLRYLPPHGGYFGTWVGRTKLGGQIVTVVNVHLFPTMPLGNGAVAGPYLRAEGIRAGEIEFIAKNLPKGGPVLVAGDFNSLSGSPAPRHMLEQGFIDSGAPAGGASQPSSRATWHTKWRDAEWQLCLDYIFLSEHFRTLSTRAVTGEGSDHDLVVSRLAWSDLPATKRALTLKAGQP